MGSITKLSLLKSQKTSNKDKNQGVGEKQYIDWEKGNERGIKGAII